MVEIDAQTTLVGIIGDPVAHSLSPRMHNAAFHALQMNWRYAAFRVPAAGLSQALRGVVALGMAGVNVTIPHKESAAGVLDGLDDLGRRIGAVKTVGVSGSRWRGFNTDGGAEAGPTGCRSWPAACIGAWPCSTWCTLRRGRSCSARRRRLGRPQ